jgi:hypothetical protein
MLRAMFDGNAEAPLPAKRSRHLGSKWHESATTGENMEV